MHDTALQEMSKVGVEALNAGSIGIGVSALKRAGINNFLQLHEMPISRITDIYGIGEKSAYRIKQFVDETYRMVQGSVTIHIDLKSRNQHQNELLKNLYILKNGRLLRTQAKEMLESEATLSATIKTAKIAVSTVKWLFAFKRKKEAAVNSYFYVQSLVNGRFGVDTVALNSEYDDITHSEQHTHYEDFERNSATYYTLLESLRLVSARTPATGLPQELVSEIEQHPLNLDHMNTMLRSYQIFGAKYILRQKKALLGDEMGLGKTIQALAVISDLKSQGATHFLVVCPASVLVNWKREIEKHTSISSIIIHGYDKYEKNSTWQERGGIGITNYETVGEINAQVDSHFAVLIVDEAHYVKNPQAMRTMAVRALSQKAEHLLYMTGTPLENRVDEMCFLISCLRPDISSKLLAMKTLSATTAFKNAVAPVYLRRLRNDVLAELPDLIESEDWLEPTQMELNAYSMAVQLGNFMAMRRVSWDIDTQHSTKAKRLHEICDDAKDDMCKVIVFSFFLKTLDKVCEILGDRALGPITGGLSSSQRQQLIDAFSEAEAGKVLVAQVQAGGFGLNIQAASVVIFCEPQIKPSLENQAISRAYRMGQVRDVQVHRLLCVNTVDERMKNMLKTKQVEFDTYAEESLVGTESLKAEADSAWIKEIVRQEKENVDRLLGAHPEKQPVENERYLKNNTFSPSHQFVTIDGKSETRGKVRSEDTASDVQIHLDNETEREDAETVEISND